MPPLPAVVEPRAQATIVFGSVGSMAMSVIERSPVVSGRIEPPVVTVSLEKLGEAVSALVER